VHYSQGQMNDLSGVWVLDSIVMKDSNKSESAKSISIEDITPELIYDCPTEAEIQSDRVDVKLKDGTIFKNITYYLDNDKLEVSIVPSYLSTYKVKFENDMMILNQVKGAIEHTYVYKLKK